MTRRPNPWIKGYAPQNLSRRLVIVCGTRTFDDEQLFQREMDKFLYWKEVAELVIGGDDHRVERGGHWYWMGADWMANEYAKANHLVRHIVRPQWEEYGKNAGPRRNAEMALYVKGTLNPSLIAFHDGKSRGTADMIRHFTRLNPLGKVKVVKYRG